MPLTPDVRLTADDPTVFAKCEPCCAYSEQGQHPRIYMRAFPARKWKKGPVCENCKGPLTVVREVPVE